MAKKIRIELDSAGIRDLMKSEAIVGRLEDVAQGVATKAGPGYVAEAGSKGKTRGRAFVQTTGWDSYEDNARNATLLKALGGG